MKNFVKLTFLSTFISVLGLSGLVHAQQITQTTDLNVSGLTVGEVTASSVALSWDENTSAGSYTVSYGTESVVDEGDSYNQPPIESDTNQLTVGNLLPNTTYYFSVIAYNSDKTSASQEYSIEVNATTKAANTNNSSFDIIDVKTINASTVEVEFNEPVLLPESPSNEVTIKLLDNPSTTLNVIEVAVKESENMVLVVNTEAQSPDTNYVIEFSEAFENATASKVPEASRTQGFTGYNASSSDTTQDAMTGLRVENIKALNLSGLNVVEVDFSDDIDLDASDLSAFTIVKSSDPNEFLTITEIKPNNQDNSKYLLVTEDQQATTYSLIMTALESNSGQTMSEDNAIIEFTGVVPNEETNTTGDDDTILLENLRVTTTGESATLNWDTPSSEANVSEVKVYLSTDKGATFNEVKAGVSPSSGTVTIDNLKIGTDNQIKVTLVVDNEETEGQIIDFEIAETGPATSLALVLVFALMSSYLLKRRNQFALVDRF